MKKCLFLLIALLYLTPAFATKLTQETSPTLVTVNKESASHDHVIADLLSLQKSLIVNPLALPEASAKTGFFLVPMTSEYVVFLLEKKEAQILCAYQSHTLLGYIILTTATEFEELYQDKLMGHFETGVDLFDLHRWLLDPAVGYIEQIGVRADCARQGIGSRLIEMSKIIKPHGLISDVFIDPIQNIASLCFFSNQGFLSPGILYQYPGAHANFPHQHKTQVFFWNFPSI